MTDDTAKIISLDAKRREKSTPEIILVTRIAQTGSRPFLGSASDGYDYWCKPPNNQQGPETLVAEVAVGVLGDLLDAPIPRWTTLKVSPDLRGQFIKDAGYRLDGRDVFASRVIHTTDIDVISCDVLQHVHDDNNCSRIPIIYAMWYLCNAEDIQITYDPTGDYSIFSIDHGFWFGSHERPWGFGHPSELVGRPVVPTLRTSIRDVYWNEAIDKLDLVDNKRLAECFIAAMPANWGIEDKLIEDIAHYIDSRKEYTRHQLTQLKNTKGGK